MAQKGISSKKILGKYDVRKSVRTMPLCGPTFVRGSVVLNSFKKYHRVNDVN